MSKKIDSRRMENAGLTQFDWWYGEGGVVFKFDVVCDKRRVTVELNDSEASWAVKQLRRCISESAASRVASMNIELVRAGLPEIEVPKWE